LEQVISDGRPCHGGFIGVPWTSDRIDGCLSSLLFTEACTLRLERNCRRQPITRGYHVLLLAIGTASKK